MWLHVTCYKSQITEVSVNALMAAWLNCCKIRGATPVNHYFTASTYICSWFKTNSNNKCTMLTLIFNINRTHGTSQSDASFLQNWITSHYLRDILYSHQIKHWTLETKCKQTSKCSSFSTWSCCCEMISYYHFSSRTVNRWAEQPITVFSLITGEWRQINMLISLKNVFVVTQWNVQSKLHLLCFHLPKTFSISNLFHLSTGVSVSCR